ncbi:acetyl esterase/lipase [Cecembia calidifontis]|uniref:Acetyl esterase/lipase n=1 Tax=Cecembia calidifontis TaxID=1187080 RepID=A0A4Q7PFT1_9BACT|nr:acetyl esterase/lipase [Cecembia calidifontis]
MKTLFVLLGFIKIKHRYFLKSVKNTFLLVLIVLALTSCSIKGVSRYRNITYIEDQLLGKLPEKKLNVFAPKKSNGDNEVLIFIHGGSWNSGKKEIYNFLGNRFARKGVVTVIIDYPLSPEYQVHDMALASAQAVKWTAQNIFKYGGNPGKIFVSGHSAGGHLASLITVREEYFDTLHFKNPIKGAVLIDAAGLDMKWFLEQMNYEPGTEYLVTFTDSPEVWKDTSPIYFLDENDPPLLILMGEKTLPGIKLSTERFLEKYKELVPEPDFHVQKGKKHKPMIVQFIYTRNKVYDWILVFMSQKIL